MLLDEGLYWINICCVKNNANGAVFFSLECCWVGRRFRKWEIWWLSGFSIASFHIQSYVSYLSGRDAGFALRRNLILLSMKLSSLTRCIFKQRQSTPVVYALQFCLRYLLPLSPTLWIVYGHISPVGNGCLLYTGGWGELKAKRENIQSQSHASITTLLDVT